MMSIALATVLLAVLVARVSADLCNSGNDACRCVATAGNQAMCDGSASATGIDVTFGGGFGCQTSGGVIACDNNGLTTPPGGFCCTPPPTPAPPACSPAVDGFTVLPGLLRCIGDTQGEFIITATAPSPTTPVTVKVNGGQPVSNVAVGAVGTATTVTGLHAGSDNSVTVTSSGGCSFTRNDVAATGPTAVFLPDTSGPLNVSNPFCFGGLGRIRLQPAQFGSPPYNYSRDNFVTTNQADIVFSGLAPGMYTFIAKDSTGCVSNTRTKTIAAAPSQVVLTATPHAAACGPTSNTTAAAALGSIDVSASGGTTGGFGPYQFSLDGGPFVSGISSFTSVAAGTHTVTVRDGLGCAVTQTVTVGTTADLTAPTFVFNPTPLPCKGAFTTLTITPVGGQTYEIDGAAGTSRLVQGTTHTIKVLQTSPACAKTFPAVVPLGTVAGASCNDNIGSTSNDHCVGDFCTGNCVTPAKSCPQNMVGIQLESCLLLCATAKVFQFGKRVELSNWAFFKETGMPTTDGAGRVNLNQLNAEFTGNFTVGGPPFQFNSQKSVALAGDHGSTISIDQIGCSITFDRVDRKRIVPNFADKLTLGGSTDTDRTGVAIPI